MFEVGKKYGGVADSEKNRYWLCVAVDGSKAWLRLTGMGHDAKEGVYEYHNLWRELKPEPKRWSTWQNLYEGDRKALRFGLANPKPYGSKETAIDASGGTAFAILRSDWEQHEGQSAKRVKVEIERD